MINLGTTDFYLKVPSLTKKDLEKYSTDLFDEWDAYVERALKLPDYSLALNVEEGSIKGAGKIGVALSALYFGIAQYGSFVAGVQTIQGQISAAGIFLADRANAPFSSISTKPKIKNHPGSLKKLQTLFKKVQQGLLTPEQAMLHAKTLFDDEASDSPNFMSELKSSFRETPLLAKQLSLPLDIAEHESATTLMNKKSQPRPLRPKPELPLNQQFRVEVWRDSKKEKRKFRIVHL